MVEALVLKPMRSFDRAVDRMLRWANRACWIANAERGGFRENTEASHLYIVYNNLTHEARSVLLAELLIEPLVRDPILKHSCRWKISDNTTTQLRYEIPKMLYKISRAESLVYPTIQLFLEFFAADSDPISHENYVPWSSRLLRYAKSRPNGKLIYNSIMNGPYVRRMIPEPGMTSEVPVPATCETAQEIWLRVQQIMKGFDIGIQEKKAKLFNEWESFTSTKGNTIEVLLSPFSQN
ncbi:hypothetical protein Tco_0109450 [Tanacetum coccineum]